MNAYAVVNPLLEAIYYFKMKANGETQAQVLDRVLKKRITTAGELTDFFGPAFELEKLLDEGIVLPERISEFFGYFKFTDGSDATSTCPAILVFLNSFRRSFTSLDEVKSAMLAQTDEQRLSGIMKELTTFNVSLNDFEPTLDGLLELLEQLPLTEESRWRIIKIYKHYNEYVCDICETVRPAVKLIADNSAVYADVLRNFSRDYADITDILKYICGRFHIDFITGRGVVYPLIIGNGNFFTVADPADSEFMAYYVGVGVRPMMHVPYRERLSIDCDEILRTLADKNRMKIMQQLSAGKSYGQELADMLGLSPNTVSHHMNKLQKSGLTTSTLEGCKVYYKTNEEVVDEFIRRLAEKLKTKDGQ